MPKGSDVSRDEQRRRPTNPYGQMTLSQAQEARKAAPKFAGSLRTPDYGNEQGQHTAGAVSMAGAKGHLSK